MTPRATVEKIRQLFKRHGHHTYGEVMTQTQHAVQAARLAAAQGQPDDVVLGALLHDIGHLLVNEVEQHERDDAIHRHQKIGADYLRRLGFGDRVTSLVERHVEGKRYLTAINSAYHDNLSPASVESLAFQGGPMSPSEVTAFDQLPDRDLYLDLRRWDDLAKDPDDSDTNLEPYLSIALHHLEARQLRVRDKL
jgi:phosphonate degradation associated HDIG domain protein